MGLFNDSTLYFVWYSFFLGVYSLTKAFAISGTISIVVLNIVTILIGQLVSLLLFKSDIDFTIYILQIIFSILIISLLNNFSFKVNKGLKLGLISSLCFGFSYPLLGIPIEVLGNVQTTFDTRIYSLTMCYFMGIESKQITIQKRNNTKERNSIIRNNHKCMSFVILLLLYNTSSL